MLEPTSIKKVCVLGAGTMGSGIAAHLANLGFHVTLMDATAQSTTEAFSKARVARPPHFYLPERANDIRLGNVAENLDWVSEADWVCEAIVEKESAKRSLYSRIAPLVREDALLSTNTSGLQIDLLTAGLPESFQERLVGAHFFNPPRYLKLLELIPTQKTPESLVAAWVNFLESRVARRVVVAKDTPGFIANRYGMWCMYHAIHTAEKLYLSIEQVDAITGPFLGRPKSGSFRLNDIVGLDVMQDIAANLISRCPSDPFIGTLKTPKSLQTLLEKGWVGEKAGQGYYRREGKELLALDLSTLAYRQKREPDLASLPELMKLPINERILKGLELRDELGEFLRNYLFPTLKYADHLKQEVSHSCLDFDHVMEWGFGWQHGPFKLLDIVSPLTAGSAHPKFYEGEQYRTFEGSLHAIKKDPRFVSLSDFPVVAKGSTYSVRDLGDDVKAVSLTTKMGVINPEAVRELTELYTSGTLNRVVLTSEARSFSAGFDLKFFSQAMADGRLEEIDAELEKLQKLGELIENSRTVSAVFGHVLGGGLEIALSAPIIAASAESSIGLPEAKVGLLPAGRGLTLARLNNQHTPKRLAEVAFNIASGAVANNAEEARVLGYLRPTDVTVFHPDSLIYEAKRLALTVEPRPRPELATTLGPISGMIDRSLEVGVAKGQLTKYDETIGQKIKLIMAKAGSYEDCLAKERSEFLDLCAKALTQARVNHMIVNGVALRN